MDVFNNIADEDINTQDEWGVTKLMTAVISGDDEEAMQLLERGADVNIKDLDGFSALMYAVENEDIGQVKMLIDAGAEVNDPNSFGTALMRASKYGLDDIVEVLLNAGADINIEDLGGNNAVFWAAHNYHTDTVKLLQQAGANLERALMSTAMTYWSQSKNLKLLIDHGADVDATDDEGRTALMLAEDDDVIRGRSKH